MSSLAFLENINGPELILIFLVVLLLFWGRALTWTVQVFGAMVREFKKATKGIEEDIRTAMDVESTPVAPRPAAKSVAQAAPQATPAVEEPELTATSSEPDEAKKRLLKKFRECVECWRSQCLRSIGSRLIGPRDTTASPSYYRFHVQWDDKI